MSLPMGERVRLAELEAELDRLEPQVLRFGQLLLQIRDEGLYLDRYPTWELYCEKRWGRSVSSVRRAMIHAQITAEIATDEGGETVHNERDQGPGESEILPATAAQTSALARIPAGHRAKAWRDSVNAAGGGQPTAEQVQGAAEQIQAGPVIPERLKPVFEAARIWPATASALQKAAPMLKAIEDSALWQQLDGGKHVFNVKLASTADAILRRLPKCPCPECGGIHEPSQDNDPCQKCNDKGFLTAEEVE